MINLRKVITNVLTNAKFVQAAPTNQEKEVFERSLLISETDTYGIITYANRRYFKLTGFDEDELIGCPHKIVRHPDMPRGVFKAMWKIISEDKIWRGYIKHLCKDGSYFWTLSYIQAKRDEKGNVIGYTSTGKMAYEETRSKVEAKYKERMGSAFIDDKYFMLSEGYKDHINGRMIGGGRL